MSLLHHDPSVRLVTDRFRAPQHDTEAGPSGTAAPASPTIRRIPSIRLYPSASAGDASAQYRISGARGRPVRPSGYAQHLDLHTVRRPDLACRSTPGTRRMPSPSSVDQLYSLSSDSEEVSSATSSKRSHHDSEESEDETDDASSIELHRYRLSGGSSKRFRLCNPLRSPLRRSQRDDALSLSDSSPYASPPSSPPPAAPKSSSTSIASLDSTPTAISPMRASRSPMMIETVSSTAEPRQRRRNPALSLQGQMPTPWNAEDHQADGPSGGSTLSRQRPILNRNRTAVSPPELTPPILYGEHGGGLSSGAASRLLGTLRDGHARRPAEDTLGTSTGDMLVRHARERQARLQSLRDALRSASNLPQPPRAAQTVTDEREPSLYRATALPSARRAVRPHLLRQDTPPPTVDDRVPSAPHMPTIAQRLPQGDRGPSPSPSFPNASPRPPVPSLWGNISDSGAIQAVHRPGALAAGRMRGPTRASNEQWLRGQRSGQAAPLPALMRTEAPPIILPSYSSLTDDGRDDAVPARFRSTFEWLRRRHDLSHTSAAGVPPSEPVGRSSDQRHDTLSTWTRQQAFSRALDARRAQREAERQEDSQQWSTLRTHSDLSADQPMPIIAPRPPAEYSPVLPPLEARPWRTHLRSPSYALLQQGANNTSGRWITDLSVLLNASDRGRPDFGAFHPLRTADIPRPWIAPSDFASQFSLYGPTSDSIAFDPRNYLFDHELDDYESMLDMEEMLGSARRTTATAAEVAADDGLTTSMYCDIIGHDEARCPICLTDYEAADQLRLLKCHHAFHVDCVDRWLLTSQNNCPTCRAKAVDVSHAPL